MSYRKGLFYKGKPVLEKDAEQFLYLFYHDYYEYEDVFLEIYPEDESDHSNNKIHYTNQNYQQDVFQIPNNNDNDNNNNNNNSNNNNNNNNNNNYNNINNNNNNNNYNDVDNNDYEKLIQEYNSYKVSSVYNNSIEDKISLYKRLCDNNSIEDKISLVYENIPEYEIPLTIEQYENLLLQGLSEINI